MASESVRETENLMKPLEMERILCPVDLSEVSRHALDHARALATWYGARLTVLHVRPPVLRTLDFPAGAIADPLVEQPDPDAVLAELQTFSQEPAGQTGSPSCVVVEGAPVTRILEFADKEKADLIVLGTHGYRGFDRLMLGSVTESVLRKARCPVMTIPPRASGLGAVNYRRLLCATDFSPASRLGFDYALTLAQERESDLCLLHVNEWPSYPPTWYESADRTDALRKAVIDAAHLELQQAVPESARNWCRIEELVVIGRPHEEIVRVAHERQSDLIVMGVHGRGALTHAIFGSTTNQVVRHAECPVLTVRG